MDLFCFFIIFLFCSSGPFIWAPMYSFFDPTRSVGSRCIFNAKIKYISVCKMANYVCDGQKIKRSFAVTVCLSVPADSTITLEKDFRKQFYHKQFSFGVKFRIDRSYFHWYLNSVVVKYYSNLIFFVIYKHWKVVSRVMRVLVRIREGTSSVVCRQHEWKINSWKAIPRYCEQKWDENRGVIKRWIRGSIGERMRIKSAIGTMRDRDWGI